MKILLPLMKVVAISSGTLFANEAAPKDSYADAIAWYGTLTSGLMAAKDTNRPILLVSAAPHCHGVSGIW